MAQSVPTPPGSEFTYQRQYPLGDLFAHVTGYYTFGFGSTGLERTQNDVLAGTTPEQQLRAIPGILDGDGDNSGTVVTTLRTDLQQVAKDALGEREGSVVVLEPATGAVQAMWSFPSLRPEPGRRPRLRHAPATCSRSSATYPGDPLLANTYQQRYMPGSTFKVLTTSIALQAGVAGLDTRVPRRERVGAAADERPDRELRGHDVRRRPHRGVHAQLQHPLRQAGRRHRRRADGPGRRRLGRRRADPDRPAAGRRQHVRRRPTDLAQNLPLLAIRGFGQNEVQMVPMHMAMVAADGRQRRPDDAALRRRSRRCDHDGNVLDTTEPAVWKTPITPETAATLRDLMVSVAEQGTASCCIALDSGIPVAAKTGTAQLNNPGEEERSNAWIVAFAPAEAPRYAVAVMLKGTNAEISAGTGGRLAGPIAKTVLDAAFAGEAGG